jgi:hypothetical protein
MGIVGFNFSQLFEREIGFKKCGAVTRVSSKTDTMTGGKRIPLLCQ